MPLLEQDLVRDTIGEADQKHMGVSYSANDALLRIRQGTAWLHAHCGKNADAPTKFKELDNQDRINLNRVWGKIDEATRALDSETKQADESLGEPPTQPWAIHNEITMISRDRRPRYELGLQLIQKGLNTA